MESTNLINQVLANSPTELHLSRTGTTSTISSLRPSANLPLTVNERVVAWDGKSVRLDNHEGIEIICRMFLEDATTPVYATETTNGVTKVLRRLGPPYFVLSAT